MSGIYLLILPKFNGAIGRTAYDFVVTEHVQRYDRLTVALRAANWSAARYFTSVYVVEDDGTVFRASREMFVTVESEF